MPFFLSILLLIRMGDWPLELDDIFCMMDWPFAICVLSELSVSVSESVPLSLSLPVLLLLPLLLVLFSSLLLDDSCLGLLVFDAVRRFFFGEKFGEARSSMSPLVLSRLNKIDGLVYLRRSTLLLAGLSFPSW